MLTAAGLDLQYPMPLGRYDQYARAQHVVDYLADQGFPVQNVEIVGTELRSIERVTGRLTRGKIATAGTLSGLWIGLTRAGRPLCHDRRYVDRSGITTRRRFK